MPIMDGEKLVGIVSDRDLKEAAPSKATSLDIWELHYLMSRIIIKDIMTKNPLTISPNATIEKAAIIMHDHKIGGLPVIYDNKLIGIITEQDIFGALIAITGARKTAHRLTVTIPDDTGTVKDLCELMRNYSFKCVSILTSQMDVEEGFRQVLIRFQANEEDIEKILDDVKNKYNNAELTID
jgi:acetoin utilization protein AcuB